METREKEQGGKNRPPNTKEDNDTHNTPDLGNSESDETGLDPDEHTGENGAAVESNGKTDENQDMKDTSQGVQGTTREAQSGMVQSAEPSIERKSASLKEETKEDKKQQNEIQVTDHHNEASQLKEGEQVCGADANISDTTEGSQTIQPDSSGGPATTPDMSKETSRATPSENRSTNQPTTDSSGEALKLKANGSVPGTTQEAQCGMVQSAEPNIERKSALKEEAKEDKKQQNEIQVTDHHNGASQLKEGKQSYADDAYTSDTPAVSQTNQPDTSGGPGTTPEMREETSTAMSSENGSTTQLTTDSSEEALKLKANEKVQKPNDETPDGTGTSTITSEKTGNTNASGSVGTGSILGDNPALTSENKESGSDNLQSESRPSPAGHGGGKVVEEEEMKTGSGENKDDPKEGSQKKEQAKEEGVKGEGGTEDAVKTEERVVKERPVSISLCTSAYRFNVEGLISYLKDLMEDHPELIKEVKVHDLPYNDLDHYRFDEKDPVDVMILCHSINNRRFAITDVMDALYDEYLPYCARVIGKEKMGVIVHDFDDMRETVQSSRMSSFKYKQPKAFETTSLQITCGHIEKEEQVLKQMRKADRDKIVGFLERASKYPEEMQKEEPKWTESLKRFIPNFSDIKSYVAGFGLSGREKEGQIQEPTALRSMGSNTQTAEPVQKNQDSSKDGTPVDPQPESSIEGNTEPDPPRDAGPATQQSSGAVYATAASGTQGTVNLPSQQQMARNSKKVFTSAPQSSSPTPRRISVSVCSSAYQNNVQGLLSWFANFQAEHPHMINDVRFRSLPYNDIDSFRFPPNDPVDVMVLCHSVDNRGFSITDVTNALYEKYLKYCNKLIGKKKLAVIVHDFADCKPATVKGRMESFQSRQPLTFDLVETVIICSRMEDSAKLGIRDEDLTRLIRFLELARFEPKENFKQSMFGKIF